MVTLRYALARFAPVWLSDNLHYVRLLLVQQHGLVLRAEIGVSDAVRARTDHPSLTAGLRSTDAQFQRFDALPLAGETDPPSGTGPVVPATDPFCVTAPRARIDSELDDAQDARGHGHTVYHIRKHTCVLG